MGSPGDAHGWIVGVVGDGVQVERLESLTDCASCSVDCQRAARWSQPASAPLDTRPPRAGVGPIPEHLCDWHLRELLGSHRWCVQFDGIASL